MEARNRKNFYKIIGMSLSVLLLLGEVSYVAAANISGFATITPFIEIESGYDSNLFEISEDASLPEDAEER